RVRSRVTHYSFYVAPAAIVFYRLSLHDALPILVLRVPLLTPEAQSVDVDGLRRAVGVPLEARSSELRFMLPEGSSQVPGILNVLDRKSTRLNSSHVKISYAVFCLKKKSVRQGEG